MSVGQSELHQEDDDDDADDDDDDEFRVNSLKSQLHAARQAAETRRQRIQVPCVILAGTLAAAAIGTRVRYNDAHFLNGAHKSLTLLLHILMAALTLSMLIAILPTQNRAVQGGALLIILEYFIIPTTTLLQGLHVGHAMGAGPHWYSRLHSTTCIAGTICSYIMSVGTVHTLFALHFPRERLQRMWRLFSITMLCTGVAYLSLAVFEMSCGFVGSDHYLWTLANALNFLLWGYLSSWTKLRTTVQVFLAGRGKQARAAATVGALIGSCSVDNLLTLSREHFRSVSLDRVTKAMLADHTPDPTLIALTSTTKLGGADAFISHSWHDDPDEKWEVLQHWRAHFKATFGREPRVWIDKMCLDQGNIKDSLASLPIYLAGCEKLLVLQGNTYEFRLWCVMELVTFIVMGGNHSNLEVHKLPSCKHSIQGFDIERTLCTRAEDAAYLNSAIEVGLGSVEKLNETVRAMVQLCNTSQASMSMSLDPAVFFGKFVRGISWSREEQEELEAMQVRANTKELERDPTADLDVVVVLDGEECFQL